MNFKRFFLIIALSISAVFSIFAQEIENIGTTSSHSIGVRGGTGWGNSFVAGLSYQYHFNDKLSYITYLDYENGKFNKSRFHSINIKPAVEYTVWRPKDWFALNLGGGLILAYDIWNNYYGGDKGIAIGAELGLNLEFYAIPELSFTLGAQQGWKYSFLQNGDYNYFCPLFSAGIKYNIR